jgi:sterol desaturase/sphingolipid hydroxylase (fatty acid hydroxylase superfamily)
VLGAPLWARPVFGGFVMGYIGYDLIHYATHHLPAAWGPLKALKRYHMQHHFKTPDQRYGVSSPSWDVVFGTKPEEAKKEPRIQNAGLPRADDLVSAPPRRPTLEPRLMPKAIFTRAGLRRASG